jgi:hypothetical protein
LREKPIYSQQFINLPVFGKSEMRITGGLQTETCPNQRAGLVESNLAKLGRKWVNDAEIGGGCCPFRNSALAIRITVSIFPRISPSVFTDLNSPLNSAA